MELKEIKNKQEWEGFLESCDEKTFLQSWSWGEFNEKMGEKIWRFGVYQNEKLISVALTCKISARRGTFLFIPHGPVVLPLLSGGDKKEILELMLTHLRKLAKNEKASFLRIAPIFNANLENEKIFKGMDFRSAPIHMHPEVTWELDITLPEDQLLMNMRKTTRYLIRKAEKDPDIEIIKSGNLNDLDKFWPVYQETAVRHRFVVFSEKYLKTELECFSKDDEILFFLGKYKGEIVSAALFVFWQDMCFYHHSGSLSKYSKVPVSYLLQWEAIKEAKNRGCKIYNFWGIAPQIETELDAQKSKHPWAGLSLFKMGFGGHKKEYVKTSDFIFLGNYWITFAIEKLRKLKRNL